MKVDEEAPPPPAMAVMVQDMEEMKQHDDFTKEWSFISVTLLCLAFIALLNIDGPGEQRWVTAWIMVAAFFARFIALDFSAPPATVVGAVTFRYNKQEERCHLKREAELHRERDEFRMEVSSLREEMESMRATSSRVFTTLLWS